ncbi:hypothetical protein CSQ91_17865 [Janthinobacterium sp. BJB301]|uniref:hypothetical protein n=1 Tax=Janthinobacterium sp. BJB301 TaxID=1560195 RepID=UPI000C0E343B|nr:hypothetical protein [Janthinobacterium sp. BJB301]PHV49285.1 hypothetical protein CSQ91_17865 [Janthinobacterium sp. BJB301]
MKKTNFGRVPVIEDALGINIAVLLAEAKKTGRNLLSLAWQGTTGLVTLEAKQVTLMFSGVIVSAEIYAVPCLNGRLRPLLKCPRAHEGNFQTLYLREGELACRHCHRLHYRSTLAPSATERARLARFKLMAKMGGASSSVIPDRKPYCWRKRHRRLEMRLVGLTGLHYGALRAKLEG